MNKADQERLTILKTNKPRLWHNQHDESFQTPKPRLQGKQNTEADGKKKEEKNSGRNS